MFFFKLHKLKNDMSRNYMSWKIIWVEIIWVEIIWNAIIWVEIIWNVTEPILEVRHMQKAIRLIDFLTTNYLLVKNL